MTDTPPPEPPGGSVVLRTVPGKTFALAWQRDPAPGGTGAQSGLWRSAAHGGAARWEALHVGAAVEVIHEAPEPSPPEPPRDHLVRDRDGDVWEWDEGRSEWRTRASLHLDWPDLARRYAPFTVYAPVPR